MNTYEKSTFPVIIAVEEIAADASAQPSYIAHA
jgi:hypothetical protein